ncbi:polysaccharide deacetylase family protein [Uliginosibacterium gangwonense]|uniref:polysaccharide deacetylase family protein n=1 Tax=Uliginosibacterium gangwonense TaxID=392736 RepID=UPI00037CC652|nr:polysaccharide deacetylase family protein [Uliginosibacterium gangwonense]
MKQERWRPPALLWASLVCHLGATTLWALMPHHWPLALGILVINHLALAVTGLLPRSKGLGPNLTRLPESAARQGWVALTIDDGPDPEVTPKVLEILAAYQAKATFFCIGKKVEAFPELAQAIVAAGHAIENHGQCHHTFNSLQGMSGWTREIADAQASIHKATGQTPRFYRPTAGLRNPFLDPVLHRLDMHLASWTRRGYDTRVQDSEQVFTRLSRGLRGGDILLLHDGNAARTTHATPVIIAVLPRLLDTIATLGLRPVTLRAVFDDPRTPHTDS